MSTKITRKRLQTKNRKYKYANYQQARTEILNLETEGYIVPENDDEEERTVDITQTDIQNSVDISSSQKYFDLNLDKFGPYRINYTKNGRHLLMGGHRGHIAAFDWQTKRLHCEINVMEQVNDVKWLHIETMFACAQKQWVYIYDNQGVELHCLKTMDRTERLEFLPYHFLLVSINSSGYLSYIDVSIGKKVISYPTKIPATRPQVMCQNKSNAIITLGHSGGIVTMWSPNQKEPLVKMLAHKSTIRSITIDQTGNYMATSSVDARLKIWDIRNTYKELNDYRVKTGAHSLAFSQKNLLAASYRDVVEIYKDFTNAETSSMDSDDAPKSPAAYLMHRCRGQITHLEYCPFEDVLGIGYDQGFNSIIVPGSGEANFDSLEANPYQTKKQRRHYEVKALLDKIQPDLISLDNDVLAEIDQKTLKEKMDEKNKLLFIKPKKIELKPKKGKISVQNRRKTQMRDANIKIKIIMDFDWDWLLILGEFGLTFGFYRWWKSKEIFVDVLEAAPDLDIENFKKWQSPIEFASVHGIIRNDVQECLTSQYTPHTKGVIKQITIREFKSEKFKNIWTQTKNVLSDVVRQVPMRLTSPSGKYVRIEQPLAFDSITDELEVTHCKFEPYATSGIQAIIQGLFGQVSTGIETKESMLLLDRPLTGVGRLEKRGQHWNLLLNDKYGGILTRLSKKEIIDQHRSSSKVIKFFTY
ncbi:unnamed protein product, partial [Didymodactylos carnosus]